MQLLFIDTFTKIFNNFDRVILRDDNYMLFIKGLGNTLMITFFSLFLGIFIGIIVAIGRLATKNHKKLKFIYKILQLYVTIIRGTPVMVQLLIIYNIVFSSNTIPAEFSAIVCFGLNSGAYVAEIFRGGIESIDKGQMEASRSLGINYKSSMIDIIVPQAIKTVLPTLGNEFISLLKETAIVGTIAIMDLTRAGNMITASNFDYVFPLLIVTSMYLIVVLGLQKLFSIIEKKLAGDNI